MRRYRGGSDSDKAWGRACLPRLSGALLAPPLLWAMVISLAFRYIRGLENRLLNASFQGSNLTLQTSTIQALVFKLGCDFAGLSLNSEALKPVPQVRGDQRMGTGQYLHPRNPLGV